MPFLFIAFLFFVSVFQNAAPAVKIEVRPQTVYIEKTSRGQSLNFDFLLENKRPETLALAEIEVSVFDRRGALAVRKFIDGNGVQPSIMTVPNRDLEAGKTILVFNPFESFAPEIELHRLVYKFTFENKERSARYVTEATVSPVFYQTKTALILPVKGRALVWDGHDFYAHHRRFDYNFAPIRAYGFNSNFMRYSYDFVPVDETGAMSRGGEEKNENFFGFGADLYAAGAGTIAAVVDGEPDNRSFDESKLTANQMVLFGNYIVIDHGNGEFSLYGHIKQHSARVRVGETVRQNQPIGRIGASGSSKFPHLHYELQTGPDAASEGLPSYFRGFRRILGSRRENIKLGQIDSGDFVER